MKLSFMMFIVLIVISPLLSETIAFLGVSTRDIDYNTYPRYDIADGYGVLIDYVVKDSAADKAGLKEDMIIRMFNQEKIYTSMQLTRMIRNSQPGELISLTTLSDGNTETRQINLGKKKQYNPRKSAWIGVNLQDDFDLADFQENYGLLVTKVAEDSPAQKAGIQIDDVILSINTDKLYSQDQVRPMLQNYEPGDFVKIDYWRAGEYRQAELELAERDLSDQGLFELDSLFYGLDILEGLGDMYQLWDAVGLPGKLHVLAFHDSTSRILGVIVSEVDAFKKEQMNIDSGLLVDEVIPQTPAAEGGLLTGDIILSINDEKVVKFDDIAHILHTVEFDETFRVSILRQDQQKELDIVMKPVTQETWQKYYTSQFEDDIIRVITDGEKPLDLYYESLDNIDKRFPRKFDIELNDDDKKTGTM